MSNQNRHRSGSPVGGRYAPGSRAAADDCVQLTDPSDEANQRLRGEVIEAAGALTGRGTIEASQHLARMTDASVAATRVRLLKAFNQATDRAATPSADSPRQRLAAVMGPMMGGGTVGVTERMGAMSGADVQMVLAELEQVWNEAVPSPAEPEAGIGQDPWDTRLPKAPSHHLPDLEPTADADPVLTAREREDLAKGDAFVHDGQMFQRRRDYVYPAEPYAIAIRTAEPIDDDQMQQIAGLTGYAYSTTGGERAYGDPERVDERTFILHVDTTKGRAYQRLDRFEDMLADTIIEGSPVRKTDRAGAGTQGTRLVEGLGRDLAPEIFYDSVDRP